MKETGISRRGFATLTAGALAAPAVLTAQSGVSAAHPSELDIAE